ncbi:GNAT family N-acetyltransferase [Flavicella sediminum]|uniref:GNAT family N-acetyltransferase n=1 Tax=Flavicella sediminum TaxID=2585141 RepID=UPI001123ADE0|nr:GNAT family N-acetyltransferase [Flavicella sediminum]
MSIFKTIPYNSLYKSEWDAFVKAAKNATFLFERAYMDYHQDRFKDFSLLIFKKEVLIAVLPANKKETTVSTHSGLTYGGIVTHDNCTFRDYCHIFKTILEFLYQHKIACFVVKPLPSIYTKIVSEEFYALTKTLEAKLLSSEISLATDLRTQINLSKSRKRGVKLGIKNGIKITEEQDLSSFWKEVLIPNLKEKYKASPVHSLQEISLLKKRFPKNIRQFNIYYEDKIIGGTTIYYANKVAHAQYTSGLKKYNSLGGIDLLFYELIFTVFKNAHYFSFGTSSSEDKTQINEALFYWKSGFESQPVLYNRYAIKTENFKNIENLWL